MVTLEEVGRRLREERLRQDKSVSKLATKAGIATSVIDRIESGEGVNLGSFMRLVDALGMPYSVLFGEADHRAYTARVLRHVADALAVGGGIE